MTYFLSCPTLYLLPICVLLQTSRAFLMSYTSHSLLFPPCSPVSFLFSIFLTSSSTSCLPFSPVPLPATCFLFYLHLFSLCSPTLFTSSSSSYFPFFLDLHLSLSLPSSSAYSSLLHPFPAFLPATCFFFFLLQFTFCSLIFFTSSSSSHFPFFLDLHLSSFFLF